MSLCSYSEACWTLNDSDLRGGTKGRWGKYRRDRKREKLNEEKNNKKNKITVSITRTNARSRC